MIELLGVGVPRDDGGWLLHRVCLRLAPGAVTAVVAPDAAEGRALLDAIAGRVVPSEGRVWIDRVPLMRQTAARIRGIVGEVAPWTTATRRSVLWNALVAPGEVLTGWLRLSRARDRYSALSALAEVGLAARAPERAGSLGPADIIRVGLARCAARGLRVVVVRDLDVCGQDRIEVLETARSLSRIYRQTIVVAVGSMLAEAHADRVVVVEDGLVELDLRAAMVGLAS